MKLVKLGQSISSISTVLFLSAMSWGQTPLYDRVMVDFRNSVNVNGRIIPPGHYEIRELRSVGPDATRILFVESENGRQFEASGATIAILQNEPPARTEVILQRIGTNYYLNRIWINGKDYGYEFPLPAEARALMRERSEVITVVASYRPEPVAVAEAPKPTPTPTPEPPPPPPPTPAPTPEPTPEPTPTPQPTPEPTPVPEEPKMPATGDNWAMLMTVGSALAALGLALRRK